MPSAAPDGYWYRIASPPWNDQYYAVDNTFGNGVELGSPYTHNTDFQVPLSAVDLGRSGPVLLPKK